MVSYSLGLPSLFFSLPHLYYIYYLITFNKDVVQFLNEYTMSRCRQLYINIRIFTIIREYLLILILGFFSSYVSFDLTAIVNRTLLSSKKRQWNRKKRSAIFYLHFHTICDFCSTSVRRKYNDLIREFFFRLNRRETYYLRRHDRSFSLFSLSLATNHTLFPLSTSS